MAQKHQKLKRNFSKRGRMRMAYYLKYKYVKIRKPHICFGCGRKFEPPSEMISAVCIDCGVLDSFYLCEICERIVSNMRHDDEFGYGDLREGALAIEKMKR